MTSRVSHSSQVVEAKLEATISCTNQRAADLIATNGTYLAFTTEESPVVNVCSIKKVSAPALKLLVPEPVHPKVSALHIGTLPSHKNFDVLLEKKLFAATRLSIHAWDIEECYAARELGEGANCSGLEIPSDCYVSHIHTDRNLRFLAATNDSEVLVYNLLDRTLRLRLEGHSLTVNAVQFDSSDRLVTVSDDRTFKVWDLEREELVYQSSIYGASPLTCVAMDPTFPRMAIGSTDGVVRFFDITSPSYQLIQSLDIPLAVRTKFGDPLDQDQGLAEQGQVHLVSSNRRSSPEKAGKWKQDPVGMGCISSVSSLHYIRKGEDRLNNKLLPVSPKLIACTTQMLVIIDAYTYDVISIISFSGYSYRGSHQIDIDTPRLFAADSRNCGCVSKICIGSAFTPMIHVVEVIHTDGEGKDKTLMTGEENAPSNEEGAGLSVFPSSPPKKLSKLYQAIDKENKNTTRSISSYESATRRKSSGRGQRLGNQPVTFHSRIKSSGYGKIEPLKFLGRQVKSRSALKKPSSNLKTARLLKSYPLDCEPVHHFQEHHLLDNDEMVHSAPILRMGFCPDGTRLASASVDKSLRTLKVPLAKHRGDGETFLGHGGPVLDACWNHTGNLILTGSSDRTACLWSIKKSQALLHITSTGNEKKASAAQEFNADIKAVKFLHLDKIIVLACMNKLHFYKYRLGPRKPVDDITRLHQTNTFSHILELTTNSQSVSDFDCHNGFISNLLISGTSAKSIEVFDADACALVRSIENAHSRAIHRIVLNSTSPYASHDKSAHELFLSAASDSSVKLWDLRAPRSVRCFAGHLNRQNPIGMAFSPCMKYIACGSEDKVCESDAFFASQSVSQSVSRPTNESIPAHTYT